MKASFIRRFGPPEVLEYGELDAPEPGPGEVRVKVLACGINHYDIFLRRGDVNRDLALPHVMGADVAGEIDMAGPDVQDLTRGQRVYVAPGYPLEAADFDAEPLNLARSYTVTGGRQWGGYAEYMIAPARFVHRDPTSLLPVQMATLPLVLTTAVHAVRTLGAVGPGQQVLIQAGASGSGAMCIQVAKALGAQVATTVGSPAKIEFVRRLGADLAINHRSESFFDAVKTWTAGRGVDVVIDNVGASVFDDNIRALRRGGHFVNFGMVGGAAGTYPFPLVFYKQIHLHGSMMGTPEELNWGFEQVRAGHIRPILDRAMPLCEAASAHREIENRNVKGKIVLVP
jgi:NADPH:quinone reductase-like Zn-dependent oxidoreductase